MKDRAVAVIGGGMAGLTAAAYLSRAGFSVTVYEQHTAPGGYVSSFRRGGFTFPAGPTSFGSNGIIFPILEELGLKDRLRFIEAKHQISWGSHDVMLDTHNQTERLLAERFPDEKKALRRYFRWVKIGSSAFHDMLESGMMFGQGALKSMLRLGCMHPLFLWAALLACRHTNRSLHDRLFKNPLLKQMLNQLGYPVMTGKNTLGMWASYYKDAWVPEGGMQVLADLLAQNVRDLGGRICLGERIRKIAAEDGQAKGVELQDGRFIPADWVVSAMDFSRTCLELIGSNSLPASTKEKLERARPSESIFSLLLGMDGSAEISAALKRFQGSHAFFTCADGKYIQLVLLSKDDPSAAPEGKHALFVGMLSPFEDWESLKEDRAAYLLRKEEAAEELIARAEEFLPGLRAGILIREAASPLTYERYTGNWKGSTAGWSWNPKEAPHFKFDEDLPLKRFYPVGHYVHNPGGVPTAMITSWYVARSIIREAEELDKGDKV